MSKGARTAGKEKAAYGPLLETLAARFAKFPDRHPGMRWDAVAERLQSQPNQLAALEAMEASGGEPDVVALEEGAILFCDCAAESPAGRRSLCYDEEALEARKLNKPSGSALAMAKAMGISLLDEAQYAALQQFGKFDTKTSSWLATPEAVRRLGGALFGDRRFDRVFTYHNGAESYYAARGFRGLVRI